MVDQSGFFQSPGDLLGRLVLGLGTQVRAHIERRYAAEFDPPGPRLREYVEALRAIGLARGGSMENAVVIEGDRIRIPRGTTRSFTLGPYARFQKVPLTLSASVAPVFKPVWGRMAIVYGAWQRFCAVGQYRDDRQPQELYERELGKIMLSLKTQFTTQSFPAGLRARRQWWETVGTE